MKHHIDYEVLSHRLFYPLSLSFSLSFSLSLHLIFSFFSLSLSLSLTLSLSLSLSFSPSLCFLYLLFFRRHNVSFLPLSAASTQILCPTTLPVQSTTPGAAKISNDLGLICLRSKAPTQRFLNERTFSTGGAFRFSLLMSDSYTYYYIAIQAYPNGIIMQCRSSLSILR